MLGSETCVPVCVRGCMCVKGVCVCRGPGPEAFGCSWSLGVCVCVFVGGGLGGWVLKNEVSIVGSAI